MMPSTDRPNATGIASYLLYKDNAQGVPQSPFASRSDSPAGSQSGLQPRADELAYGGDLDTAADGDLHIIGDYGKPPKKPQWVPPPTYPYNLIPGRDLTVAMSQPRPQQVPSTSTLPPKDANAIRSKSNRQKKRTKRLDGTEDDWDDDPGSFGLDDSQKAEMDAEMEDGGVHVPAEVMAILGTARQKEREREREQARIYAEQHGGMPPPSQKPKSSKDKPPATSKGKEKEKERSTKDERQDKSGSKSKDSKSKSKSNKVLEKLKKSDKSSSKSKGKAGGTDASRSVSFSANQGVRLENARSAVFVEPEYEEEPEEEVIDTHLYCVCKTLYDDESIMIACDQCDEWYHPRCVGLVEDDLDLVDLFICPPCTTRHPQLHSTFKVACHFTTCRKPARLPLSKFCSDECGISCVMERVDQWNALEVAAAEVSGSSGITEPWERLHECSAIRQAKRREGIVVVESDSFAFANGSKDGKREEEERTLARYRDLLLNVRLNRSLKLRAIAASDARNTLLNLAVQRCELREFGGKCGFDTRVLMDEGEWEDWVEGEEGRGAFEGPEPGREKHEEDVDWYCYNKTKCDRHFGWQKVKTADFDTERQLLERDLEKLDNRERDLLGRIDDILAVSTPPETTSMEMDPVQIVNGFDPGERPMKVEEI